MGGGRGVATRLQVSLFTTLYLSFGVEEQGSPSHQDKDFMAVKERLCSIYEMIFLPFNCYGDICAHMMNKHKQSKAVLKRELNDVIKCVCLRAEEPLIGIIRSPPGPKRPLILAFKRLGPM